MPIPTEPVGSLPRPKYLQDMFAAYDAGTATREQLLEAQDKAAADSVQRSEETGAEFVTDGEQRASSFATYPIIDTLGGKGLSDKFAADGQFFAIFDDGHSRQLPRLVKGPLQYTTYAADYYKKSKPLATKASLKQAVIAPSMLYLLYPLQGEIEGYPRAQFVDDLVNECEKDIRQCFEAGAARVSIDFTEGRLATKRDPRNPWTGANLLQTFIDLNNRVLARFTPAQRANIGVHTCPGGDCDSVHSKDVDYHELLPSMFQINAGYFLIQCASEPDKDKVYREIGQCIRRDADGVAFIGVIDPLNPKVETPEEVADQLVNAAKHIAVDQLGATDDCGFSPFSIDVKPKHGSPDFARDVAFQKIASRVKGVKLASEKLGV
ncbi:5-methyltetrahydropteroyltriglutamate-homocysteine methyltransferase [Diplodia corticola]|uniref:5-methyltetrahydropteroyltriglutamate-homocysteine methyltransferase n=1 Tax=Diplodia corticola TaxID=236234 RepID=A0A1J9QTH8_9PEZI|nr:5-methyltetrahydropteroyltriglutamate-homocysteine methyltransferase [Diplodia corticola]OJD31697.1 5-methyltetrahydropteroyltriglutamate-homocysteine methyltransferase [Diplodia corticola]